MRVPILTYGANHGFYKKYKDKVQAEELRFLRRVKGCTRAERIRNLDIRAEIYMYNTNNRLEVLTVCCMV
jgi:hypothetical protein